MVPLSKELIIWRGLIPHLTFSFSFPILQLLFHTAGIVILTLLFNATTVSLLLKALGMSDISNARRLTVATAVRRINEAKQRAISMLKSDRFLADAHWEIVEKKTMMEDPYHRNDDEIEVSLSIKFYVFLSELKLSVLQLLSS